MAAPHPALLALVRGDQFPARFRVTMSVVESAAEHGLAPLLDDAAQRLDLAGDHDALVNLAMWSLRTRANTVAAAEALSAALDTADAVGLEIAVFKGPSIGLRWYPRPELRPAVDIDVFVKPSQIQLLGTYVDALDSSQEARDAIDAMVETGRVFEHTVKVQGVTFDVHVDPMNLVVRSRQDQLVWARTQNIFMPTGREVRALDLELSIVNSLLNAFRDNFADLLHIYDIALMLEHDPDWEFIAEFAETEGWTDLVRVSLGFVCDVLQIPSPLPRATSLSTKIILDAIWPNRILGRGDHSLVTSYRRQSLASLLIAGRRLTVTRALLQRLFPERAVIDLRFPDSTGSYPAALYQWRMEQRRRSQELRHQMIDR